MKPEEDRTLKRLLGQDWIKIDDFESEGFRVCGCSQEKYITQLINDVNKFCDQLGLRPVKDQSTPTLHNEHKAGEIDEQPGLFAPHAKSIVQSSLFIARCTRLEVLFAGVRLSRYFTKWTLRQDQWLLRLVGYLQRTKKYKLWIISKGGVPFCERSQEKALTKWDGARCEKWNLSQNGTMADRFVRERIQITMFY